MKLIIKALTPEVAVIETKPNPFGRQGTRDRDTKRKVYKRERKVKRKTQQKARRN